MYVGGTSYCYPIWLFDSLLIVLLTYRLGLMCGHLIAFLSP